MGDGLVPKQTKHTPSSPRATPSFISARQQGTQTPAAAKFERPRAYVILVPILKSRIRY